MGEGGAHYRYWLLPQLMLLHERHVPGLEPTRYWLVAQPEFGMVVHLNPLVVPLHVPERCWPLGHLALLQPVHFPAAVVDDPDKNCSLAHVGRAAHLNPSVVPLHEPVRYCELEHTELEHLVHVPFALELAPLRKVPVPHVACGQHVYPENKLPVL